jgi:hypothetical protein
MVLLITQNTHVKIPRYPLKQSFFFFVFSDDKNVIWLYLKIKKTWIPLLKKTKKTFIHSLRDEKLKIKILLVDHLTFVINIHKNIVTIGAGAMGYFGIKNSKVHNGFNKTIITNITGELMGLRILPS